MSSKKTSITESARKSLKSYEAKQNVADHREAVRAKDNRLAIIVTSIVFVVALLAQYVYFSFGPGVSPTSCITFTQAPAPLISGKPNPAQIPDAAISECRDWTGSMTINKKVLNIKLFGKKAPQAVANFVNLSSLGFYTDNKCHRLTTSGLYVLQCGATSGDANGGPGYSFGPLENVPVASNGGSPLYTKGMLAMARVKDSPTSQGSQFFIVYKDSTIPSDKAGGYTVFGEITSGLDQLLPVFQGGIVGGGTDGKPKVAAVINDTSVK
ncbi:MAG: peptidylprolyl isomerase [Micrococcales bacterium]|nr:peptidylprolyl isomerase [Micrococcales bacterium]